MEKPKTLQEFKSLLKSMEHRERFVFKIRDNKGYLEVYSTYTKEGYGYMNICLQVVDEDGTGKPNNKLLKLWSDNYFKQIYELLK